jgi:hypothetical protein
MIIISFRKVETNQNLCVILFPELQFMLKIIDILDVY